jgi:hypothetical protein
MGSGAGGVTGAIGVAAPGLTRRRSHTLARDHAGADGPRGENAAGDGVKERAAHPSVVGRTARIGDDGSSWLRLPDSDIGTEIAVRTSPVLASPARGIRVAAVMGKRRGAAGVSQLAPQDVPGPEYRLLLLLRGLLLRALLLRSLLLGSH